MELRRHPLVNPSLPTPRPIITSSTFDMTAEPYGKKNPFPAPVLGVRPLTAPGSAKETIHAEFSLEGSGLEYITGDALGVIPCNDPALADALIAALGLNPDAAVPTPEGDAKPLREALISNYDITTVNKGILTKWNTFANCPYLAEIIEDKEKLNDFCWGRDLLDLAGMNHKPNFGSEEAFVGILKKLMPRLYSIASSPTAHPGQVHLCVGAVRYTAFDRQRGGVCSTFMADRMPQGSTARVFIHSNKNFRLPENSALPIIMVGPGTGIAPFRAFWEERIATGATGPNWLFFGNPHQATDGCYTDELDTLVSEGNLKLSVAWSRDQAEKVYVQHLMEREGAELWAWLEKGACFYVCGDASRMAKDVEQALLDIISRYGHKTADEAAAYLAAMKTDKRYQRDVY